MRMRMRRMREEGYEDKNKGREVINKTMRRSK